MEKKNNNWVKSPVDKNETTNLKNDVIKWLFLPKDKAIECLSRERPVISIDIETYSPNGFPELFQDLVAVVGIGISYKFDGDVTIIKQFVIDELNEESEAKLFQEVVKYLNDLDGGVIVSYNGARFDIPYLIYRGQKHCIDLWGILSKFRHVDVYYMVQNSQFGSEIWREYGHVRLSDCEKYFFGRERKTTGINGGNFAEYFRGNREDAFKYNQEDVSSNIEILKKLVNVEENRPPPLKDYQERIISEIKDNGGENIRSLVQLPTGTGKTRIILERINECIKHRERGIIVVPTISAIQNVWIKEIQKWGIKGQFVTFHGGLWPWERKRCYDNIGDECSIIITPRALRNDVMRGWLDLSKFNWMHFDEAHHAIAREFGGWRNNLDYGFLKEWNGKLITGTTIKSDDERIKALKDTLRFETITDPRAKTQRVVREVINVEDIKILESEKILRKGIGYYSNIVKKLTGVDDQKDFFYIKDKFKDITKGLKDSKIAEVKSAWKKTTQLYLLRQFLFEDLIKSLRTWVFEFMLESTDKRYTKMLENFLKSLNGLAQTKTRNIIKKVKELYLKKNKILIHTRTRVKARQLKYLLEKNKIKAGILQGGMDNLQKTLEEYLSSNSVVIMTPVGVESLNLNDFDVLIHLSPYWSEFRRTQLRGRIRGGKEIYFIYEGTSEENKLNSNEESLDFMPAKIIIDEFKENIKTYITVEKVSENKFRVLKIRKTEEREKVKINEVEIPIYIEKEANASVLSTSVIGEIGECFLNWYLSEKGFLVVKPNEALREYNNLLSEEEGEYIKKLCGSTLDFIGFKEGKRYLIEVKTRLQGGYSTYSRLQREMLKEGNKLGFSILRPIVCIDKDFKFIEIDDGGLE